MKKILIAIDGSENSKKALIKAKELAELKMSDIYILTVVENLKGTPTVISSDDKDARISKEIQDAEDLLKVALELFKDYPGVVKADYKVGDVATKIIEVVEDRGIDLIVMGRRGLGSFSRTFLGSISNKVLNNVSTSVLIVK